MEPKKFIDFIITQKCTYRCQYCSQSKGQANELKNADLSTINSFYKLIDKLDDKDWEITITGGEAILHPEFYNIVETLKTKDFKINLITNLSFSIETYEKIFTQLNENLNQFDISLHLTQIMDFNFTLKKLELFLEKKPINTKTTIYIPIFNIDEKQELKIEKILKLAQKYNVPHSFQKIRFLNKQSKQKSNTYKSKHKLIKTFGKLCYAGAKSLVIYENGNAYRCYSSRFMQSNFLGNINDENFKLNIEPKVCCLNCCTCPKPSNYNQITEKIDTIEAYKTKLQNLINLPKLMFKNREIIKTKFKQKFNLK